MVVWAVLVVLTTAEGVSGAEADDPKVEERRRIHLLIRDLGDAKFATRAAAEKHLVALGDKALDDLVAALESRHRAVSTMAADRRDTARARAARALGGIGGDRAAQHLLAALGDNERLVRRAAITALGDLKHEPAAKELRALLDDDDPVIACDAARALGALGDRPAVSSLAWRLDNRAKLLTRYKDAAAVSRLRSAAAFALGMIGDAKGAAPALIRALRDADVQVRRHADLALRRLSGRNVGFKPDAPAARREPAVKAWEAYWKVKLR
jgi:HEAT repeat protein